MSTLFVPRTFKGTGRLEKDLWGDVSLIWTGNSRWPTSRRLRSRVQTSSKNYSSSRCKIQSSLFTVYKCEGTPILNPCVVRGGEWGWGVVICDNESETYTSTMFEDTYCAFKIPSFQGPGSLRSQNHRHHKTHTTFAPVTNRHHRCRRSSRVKT